MISTPIAIMASKEEVDEVRVEVEVRSVTEVDESRSVAEGVEVLAEVDDWI